MTITPEDYAALERRMRALETAVGDTSLKLVKGAPRPALLPNGQYNLLYSEYQIHTAIGELVGEPGVDDGGGALGVIRRQLAALEKVQVQPSATVVQQQPVDVVGALAALNIHVAPNVLAVGMDVDPTSGSQLQLAGARGASILGRSNVGVTDGQNPGEVHTNSIHVCDNDGGLRFLQYGFWGQGGFMRNTLNRAMTVLALDSQGDLCQSKTPIGETKDGGQNWYIITNIAEKFVRLCTFKLGWKLQLREASTQYAATETDVIAAAVEAALKARGL